MQRTIAASFLAMAACSPNGPAIPDGQQQQIDARPLSSDAALHADDAALHADGAPIVADDAALHADGAPIVADDAALHADDAAILADDAAIRTDDASIVADDAAIRTDDASIVADDAAIRAADAAATFDAAPPRADAASAAPSITSLSPTTENLLGGDIIELRGSGFTGVTDVTFDDISGTSLIPNGDSRLTVVAPAHRAGLVDVVVTTPNGSATLTAGFSYGPGPIVDSVTPQILPSVGGGDVDVTGSNLASTVSVILENGSAATLSVISDNEVQWISPSHPTGPSVATLTTPFGSVTIDLQFDAPPTIDGITPNHGPVVGGTEVTLDGTNFTDATSVTVCGIATLISVISDTELTFATPPNAAGTCEVIVTTPGGVAPLVNGFSFDENLTLNAITPSEGSNNGGTVVSIAGQGFSSVTDVYFGTTAGTSLTILSDNALTVITPPGTGTVDITIATSDLTSAATPSDQFTYRAPPVILSVSPSSAPYTGGIPITICGSGFTGVSVVRFDLPNGQGGAGYHNYTIVSDTEIDIPSPNYFSITTTNVIVDSPFGEGEDDGAFTFTNPVN